MPPRSRKSTSIKTTQPSPLPATRTPAEALTYFRPFAEQLAATEITVCRADLPLALHNVQLGITNVQPHTERLKKELPSLDLASLWGLSDLAAATMYAADLVGGPVSKAAAMEKLAQLRKLREPMLLIAEGLALCKLLPIERVAAIRAGSGNIDSARDGIALAALYREYATTLANKHPFSEAQLREADELGSFLVRAVTPQGGRRRAPESGPAVELRDRLFALLSKRHKELRKAGHYLFGDDYDQYVPLLGSRVLGARKSGGETDTDEEEAAATA